MPNTRDLSMGSSYLDSSNNLFGDIIWVPNESEIPADILFIGGGLVKKKNGQVECYVKTSSLDGEKNLKKKAVPKLLKIEDEKFEIEKQKLSENVYPVIQGQVICELPNKDLNQFHGILKLSQKNQFNEQLVENFEEYILTENNLLLKGTKLMNTYQGISGVVIYSGLDTKLLQNQNKSRYKQSKVELETNRIVIGMLVYTIIASLVLAWLSYRQNLNYGDTAYYLYNLATDGLPSKNSLRLFILNFLSNICLNCTFIPISLIVAIECTKIVQAFFMISDIELISVEYDENLENDVQSKKQDDPLNTQINQDQQNISNYVRQPKFMQQCKVQTCSLNEELGQIRFIFSDKTGTLTRNIMEFKMCGIGSQIYGDENLKYTQENKNLMSLAKNNEENMQNNSIGSCRSNNEWEQESLRSKVSRISHRSNVNQKQGATYSYLNQNLENIVFNLKENETIKCPIIMVSKNNNAIYKLQYQKKLVNEFFQCLAIAHECLANSVIINNQEQVTYQGTSPDEVALLEFAQKHGFKFQHATDELIQVIKSNNQQAQGYHDQKILEFELIKKIEFNSDRKRMSVIVKDLQDGLYKMYTKGADNVILDRLKKFYNQKQNTQNKNLDIDYNFEEQFINQTKRFSESEKSIQECKKNLINTSNFLNKASIEGYRTLLIAMKILDIEEVKQFLEDCNTAEKDLFQRNKNLSIVYDKWEQDLYLIGATVVEDRLQDQVPETIKALHQADIKLWVLTGDKLETAESIGFSCQLLNYQMDIIKCRNENDAQLLFSKEQSKINQNLLQMGKKRAIIIESQALKYLLDNQNIQIQRWFLKISKTMETVICCRVSPIQKAEVVRIVKQDDPDLISLAIGDGANDVPMILEADIGIGIFGKEGMRAVDSSDYAIAEFRHLWTLLFKWGRWNYNRQCMNINYYFYKNFVYTLFQILFQMSNFYSSQTIFPDAFLSLFNMMFTAWPIACFAVNEIDIYPSSIDSETQSKTQDQQLIQDSLTQQEAYDPALIRFLIPYLYYTGQRCLLFNQWVFIWWILRGLFECLVIYIITYLVFTDGNALNKNGETGDLWTFGMTIFTSLLYVVTNKLLLKIQKYDTLMIAVILFLTFFFYYMFIYITDSWYISMQSSFTFYVLYTMPIFYLTVIFCISICFLIDLLFESFSKLILTDQKDLLKLELKKDNFQITQEFLNEFNRLSNMQKNISAIEDELKEQEIDLQRTINSGINLELQSIDKGKGLSLKSSERFTLLNQNAATFNILSLKFMRVFQNMLLRYTNLIPQVSHSEYQNQNLKIENQKEYLNIGYFIKSEKKELIADNLEIQDHIQFKLQEKIKQQKNNKVINSPMLQSEYQNEDYNEFQKYNIKRIYNQETIPTSKKRKSEAMIQQKEKYLQMKQESEEYQIITKVTKNQKQQSVANTQDIEFLEESKSSRGDIENRINKNDQILSFLHQESLEIAYKNQIPKNNIVYLDQDDQFKEIESIYNDIALKYD